jgi:two-component system, cell cycle sensor histidine kinase and response regulator CckA
MVRSDALPHEALLASENRLRVILGCTKGIVFEFDREARYLDAWTHDAALLAQPREELIGHTINEVLGALVGLPLTSAIRRVFDGGPSETIEYELSVQGGRRWFVADVVVAPPVPGRDRSVVFLVRDITAHKHVEEQLRQAQKMEALGRLAGGISHDFSNILTTIIGYSEMLIDGLDAKSAQRKQASRIRHAAERATALTRQLLAYSRQQMLVPEMLDVNLGITSLAHILRRLIGDHIDLRLQLDEKPSAIRIDRSALEQVIMNLVINARDAIDDAGEITLGTECVGNELVIVCTDNGRGMDAETKERIFDPFFTTKELGKGTGLGLATVYGIVNQSGGHVEVASEPDHGATFRVSFPRVECGEGVPIDGEAHVHRVPLGLTVLIVENDNNVRQVVRDHLSSAGYGVVVVEGASQALELAQRRAFDVLVTDVAMPRMRGDQLAARMRELQPDMRVLYISGNPQDPRPQRSPGSGNSLFLQKPFSGQVLVRSVGALFETQSSPSSTTP